MMNFEQFMTHQQQNDCNCLSFLIRIAKLTDVNFFSSKEYHHMS